MSDFADHEAYIAAAPEQFRPLLAHLRAELAAALPGIEELISYNMPGFGTGKVIVAGYAAFSKQCGLYVANAAIAAHSDEITAAGLKHTKTGVTFTVRKPLPDELIRKLAEASRRENGL